MTTFRVVFVLVFSICFVFTNHCSSTTTSSSFKSMTSLNNNITFDNKIDLPTLKAVLQYTYDPTKSTLSIAFTARPPTPTGWVSWSLNPNGTSMAGAQALIAFKPNNSGPISVHTYNIVSKTTLIEGPISYNVSGLSAQESNGDVTIFATWDIPRGQTSVNTVWQVGPVTNGKPGKHDLEKDNVGSTLKLSLVNGPSGAPEVSPSEAPTPSGGDANPPAPSPPTPSGGAHKGVVSLVVLLGALMVCFL